MSVTETSVQHGRGFKLSVIQFLMQPPDQTMEDDRQGQGRREGKREQEAPWWGFVRIPGTTATAQLRLVVSIWSFISFSKTPCRIDFTQTLKRKDGEKIKTPQLYSTG